MRKIKIDKDFTLTDELLLDLTLIFLLYVNLLNLINASK